MNNKQIVEEPIIGETVADVWLAAMSRLTRPGIASIGPLSVSVLSPDLAREEGSSPLRAELDRVLKRREKGKVTHTVANTIFPLSLWNRSAPRKQLYERFLTNVRPSVSRCKPNQRGHYFHRMVAFHDGPHGNQLEHVIDTWKNHANHRHSALQVCIFDPVRDHTNSKQQGFPCLHQVCFTPLGNNGGDGLAVTAFYATQHIVTKAYGNYLGLIRLGSFVAHELDMQLRRMTCIAGMAKLGDKVSKEDAIALVDSMNEAIQAAPDC